MKQFPSLKNKNPLSWKCKLFGCQDKLVPLTFYDNGEKHGIKEQQFTAMTTSIEYEFRGCYWCNNFRKIFIKETLTFPVWGCYCDICDAI